MTATSDTARQTALNEIEQREKASKWVIIAAALIESILLLAIFTVIDLSNDTQALIFLTAMLVYLPVCFGMMALGYWAGRTGGRKLLERSKFLSRWMDRVLPWAEGFFHRHGAKTIFIGRFFSVLRETPAIQAAVTRRTEKKRAMKIVFAPCR